MYLNPHHMANKLGPLCTRVMYLLGNNSHLKVVLLTWSAIIYARLPLGDGLHAPGGGLFII